MNKKVIISGASNSANNGTFTVASLPPSIINNGEFYASNGISVACSHNGTTTITPSSFNAAVQVGMVVEGSFIPSGTIKITATDSSDAFDAQSVTAVRFFTAEGVRITDLDTEFRKSGRLQRAEFDFQLTTNGAVEFGDVLTIEIKVELGRGL